MSRLPHGRGRACNKGVLNSWIFAALIAQVLLLVACGGGPAAEEDAAASAEEDAAASVTTSEGATSDSTAPGATSNATAQSPATSLQDVYAQVAGLTGDERRQTLTELASQEEGPITFYTSLNVDDSEALTTPFREETGLEVSVFRAPNEDLLRRVLEEEEAQVAEVADVISNNGLEQAILAREGVLAPLTTPATEGNAFVEDTWAGIFLAVYLAAWNTDIVSPGEEPASWEEVFSNYPGQLAYQLGDVSWFATLVNDWYVEEQGMTEREAVDMIVSAVSQGADVIDGHTLAANLLVAGEYAVASSLYHNRVATLIEEGAPIEWEPAVTPLIIGAEGVGIHGRTQRPASALLLTEYMLTDLQPRLQDDFEGRTPAVEGVPGGLPAEYDPMPINLDLVLDDQAKWQAYHDEVTGAIGGEVIE